MTKKRQFTPMTDERRKEIEDDLLSLSGLPWKAGPDLDGEEYDILRTNPQKMGAFVANGLTKPEAKFLSRAPETIQECLEEIDRLKEENDITVDIMADGAEQHDADQQEIINRLRKEIDRLKGWVNDLHSGMYINCVYCGHRYGPNTEVPASMADVLKEHVEQCPEHPMSKLKEENRKLKEFRVNAEATALHQDSELRLARKSLFEAGEEIALLQEENRKAHVDYAKLRAYLDEAEK